MKPLKHHKEIIVDGQVGVVGAPEPFVPRTPLRHRLVTLALIDGVPQVDLPEPANLHRVGLDDGDRPVIGVHDRRKLTRHGQRLALRLVVEQETGRRDLLAAQDRRDQLVAQRSGKGKLGLGQGIHSLSVNGVDSHVT